MEAVMRFCALCVMGALLAVLLKRTNPDMALLLALAVCGAALLLLAEPLDAGEGAMASLVETAGAVIAILVSLPLFQAAWDMLRSLL